MLSELRQLSLVRQERTRETDRKRDRNLPEPVQPSPSVCFDLFRPEARLRMSILLSHLFKYINYHLRNEESYLAEKYEAFSDI